MEKTDRIKFLTDLTEQEPNDPFAWYALCLESEAEPAAHFKNWLELLNRFPDYLPLYYQSGKAAARAKLMEEAVILWQKGVKLATLQNDRHTLAELNSAIQNALLEDDTD